MRKQKVNINFARVRQAELVPMAMKIVDTMTANKVTFPTPTPTLASITELVTALSNALGKAEYPGRTGDIRNLRKQLEDGLATLGTYVNGIAKGDLAILEESGFPISKEPTPHGEIPAPTEMGVELMADGGFYIWATPPVSYYNGVLFAFTPITNTDNDPYNWPYRYSPDASINLITGFVRGAEYKFAVAFLGSVGKINWAIIGKTLFAQ